MERQRASSLPYMGLVDRRPVVCRNLAMGFWVPLQGGEAVYKRQGEVRFSAAFFSMRAAVGAVPGFVDTSGHRIDPF